VGDIVSESPGDFISVRLGDFIGIRNTMIPLGYAACGQRYWLNIKAF
jgi:hypothetical protein